MADQSTPTIQQKGGLVGIGVASPSYKLDVRGTSTILGLISTDGTPTRLIIQRSTVPLFLTDMYTAATTAGASWSINKADTSAGSSTWSSSTNVSYASAAIRLNADTATSYITFLTASAVNTNPSEVVRITGAGNVGIGTTSPSSILQIEQATPIFTLNQTTANSNQGIYFNNSGTNYGRITSNAATGLMTFQSGLNSGDGYLMRFITDGSERMRITSGGFVGIGDSNPAYKLGVYDSNQYVAGFINNVADQLLTVTVQNSAQSTAGVNTAASTIELVGKAGTSSHGRHSWIGSEGVASATYRTKLLFKIRGESNTGYTWSGASAAPTIVTMDGNGQVSFNQYTSASSFTGTAAGVLAFDSSGNIITQSATLYPSGSGTTNYVTKWTGANTLGNSLIFDNGSYVFIGATSNAFGLLDLTVSPSSYTAALGIGNITPASEGQSTGISFKHRVALDGTVREGARIAAITELVTVSGYQSLAFYTMNVVTLAERMRILYNGNVGIGTTSPSALLDIQGTAESLYLLRVPGASPHVRLRGANGTVTALTTSANGNRVGQVSFEPYVSSGAFLEMTGIFGVVNGTVTSTAAPTDLVFAAGSSGAIASNERMRILSTGNVGIGTSNPAFGLSVYRASIGQGDTSTNLLLFDTTSYATGVGGGISFGGYYDSSNSEIYTYGYVKGGKENSTDGNFSGYLSFGTRAQSAGSSAERMRITSAGNVGIGVTSPTQTLDVNGTTLLRGNVYTQGEQGIELGWSGSTINDQRIGRIRPISTPTQNPYAGGLAFDYYKYSGTQYQFYEGIRLTGSGNVGIGTTGPICILDVTDSGAVISGTATVGSNMKGIRVYNTTSATQNNAVGIWFSTGPHQAGIASFRANPASTWETSLAFYTHVDALSNLNDATEKMRLTGEGSLLVGGTSTAAGGVIQAQGTSTTTISIRTTVAGNGAPRLKFYHDGNDEFVIRGGDGVAFLTSGVNVRYSMNSSGQSSYNLSSGAAAIGNGINISTQQGTYTSGHGGILQFQNEDVITAGIRGVRTTGWGSGMLFYVHNESAGNTINSTFVERMRINELGNVAIGTTTPSTRFVVYDDTQDRFNIRIQSTIANNNNKYMGIGFSGEEANTKGAIFFQSIGASYSRGNMLFCLNNAQDQSNAVPSDAVLTLFTNTRNATFVGSVTATAFFESSDSRIKTLLDNNTDYSLVASIEARYYDKNGVQELGYFAQDFEQILPSAVQKDDEGFLNLSYTQVHTAKIAALEKEVAELKKQLKQK